MNCNYKNITEVLQILNNCGVDYVILRNYENLLSDELYVDGHGDIDILCADSIALAKSIQANKWNPDNESDKTHYRIFINGASVSLDLRYVGDGYYCTKWQTHILNNKVFNGSFYIMDEESYFYTLAYHAILQKRVFTEEYQQRLSIMAMNLGISLKNYSKEEFVRCLNRYLKDKAYKYTYPIDKYVPLNIKYVDKALLKYDFKLAFRHLCFDSKVTIIELLVRIKHLLQL